MTDSPQPRTMRSTYRGVPPHRSGKQHGAWVDEASLLEEMGRYPLGTLVMTGRVVPVYRARPGRDKYAEKHIECVCSVCQNTYLIYPSNVRKGKTTSCRCQRNVRYENDPRATVLGKRASAMIQRCNTPTYPEYPHYGGRGIEYRFKSREHFIRWALEYLPHETYKGVDIDRRDNDGHYEPGNLRLVSRRVNLINKRTTRWVIYQGKEVAMSHVWHLIKTDNPDFPLGAGKTCARLRSGERVEDLLALVGTPHRIGGRPHNPLEVPNQEVVAIYRGPNTVVRTSRTYTIS